MVCTYKTKRMILSLLMILVLLITWMIVPWSYSRAVLAEVTVVGEVVMTLATLASIMMVAFGASGMDGAVRNQAAETGTQPLTYVGQLLNRWISSAASNMGFSTLASIMQEGFSYLPDGTIYLDSDATAAVADFQLWAWSSDGADLESYAPVVSASDSYVDSGVSVALVTTAEISPQSATRRYGYYVAQHTHYGNGAWWDYAIGSTSPGAQYYVYLYVDGHGGASIVVAPVNMYSAKVYMSYTINGTTYYNDYGSDPLTDGLWTQVESILYDSSSVPLVPVSNIALWGNQTNLAASQSIAGDLSTFVGPMQSGQGTMLPLSDNVTVSSDAAARLHLDNYLRAAAAAYAGTGTASVPVTDVGTGDEDTLPLSVPLDTPIGVTGVTDSSIDQSGSVAGSDAVASDFEGLDDYTMDLTQFFPFCVPFDLAYLFEKLRAQPEALVIDWHFLIPYLDVDIPVEIDLSPFDSLAQLLRSLEVIAFIVALLVGTKNLIQGGD